MAASPDEIAAMQRVMEAMGGSGADSSDLPDLFEPAPGQKVEGDTRVLRSAVVSEEQQAMKDILLKLNENAFDVIGALAETASVDMSLKAALVTEKTARGARIGSWEIVKHGADAFDVCHVDTGEPIAKSLVVYETAYGLAKKLNEGFTLTDKPIRELLKLEEDFSRNRAKAKQFTEQAKRMASKGEVRKAAIAEDRRDDAKFKAQDEYDRLLALAGLR